jgi:hypothetical protein
MILSAGAAVPAGPAGWVVAVAGLALVVAWIASLYR